MSTPKQAKERKQSPSDDGTSTAKSDSSRPQHDSVFLFEIEEPETPVSFLGDVFVEEDGKKAV